MFVLIEISILKNNEKDMIWYNVRQIMGYQTNDTKMCPWPKQLLNIPFI